MVMETRIFTKTPFLGDCQKKLKNDSLANEVETISARNQTGISKSPEISNSNTFIKFPRRHFCVQNCNLTPPLIFVKTLRNIVDDWFLGKKLIECED